ncbi:MAG: hypothetical protein ACM3S2_10965 [Ignavibacteriales bacterium]
MKLSELLLDVIIVFAVTLIVSLMVTYLFNVIFYNEGIIEWVTSVRLAVIFAIIIPLVQFRKRKHGVN